MYSGVVVTEKGDFGVLLKRRIPAINLQATRNNLKIVNGERSLGSRLIQSSRTFRPGSEHKRFHLFSTPGQLRSILVRSEDN